MIEVSFGDFGNGVVLFENAFDEGGDGFDFFDHLDAGLAGHASGSGELESHHEEDRDLAGEGFGGGHRDFRPGVKVNAASGLAGNGRADRIDKTGDEGALVDRFADSGKGVGGFT